jgi:hypothetical protein
MSGTGARRSGDEDYYLTYRFERHHEPGSFVMLTGKAGAGEATTDRAITTFGASDIISRESTTTFDS